MILNTYKKIRCAQLKVPYNHGIDYNSQIPSGLQVWGLTGGGCNPSYSGTPDKIVTSIRIEGQSQSSSGTSPSNAAPYDILSTYYNPYYTRKAGWFFRFGSGTTPVQPTDTKLENDITAELSQVQGNTLTTIDENEELITTVTMSASNPSETNKIISEIGIAVAINYLSRSDVWTSYAVILRELLPEPITLEPNKSCNITFEIRGIY